MIGHRTQAVNGAGRALAFLLGWISCGAVGASAEAKADPALVIVGLALNAEYAGSSDYTTVPMLVLQASSRLVDLEIEGLTTYASLLGSDRWRLGVAADLDLGRDEEVRNAQVASMQAIDWAVNLGGLLSYNRPDFALANDNLEFRLAAYTDVSGVHNGRFSTLGMTYTLPLMIPWRFEFELETTYADAEYMQTYFGVDEHDSSSSGLPRYSPGASFRDVSFITNIGLFFNPRFGLFARLNVSHLLDDAKGSPIIELGDARQYFVGVGMLYRFGE